MRILLATYVLDEHTGAELYVRDLARGLLAKGCEVVVYAVNAGALAWAMVAEGIEVVDDLGRVAAAPDLIHAHQQPALLDSLTCFPLTPAVYLVHDATSPLGQVFPFPRVRRHVAVDERCLGRIVREGGVQESERRVILNFVDLQRFKPRPPLPASPRRALVFSNYAKAPGELAALRAACEGAGLTLDMAGKAAGRPTQTPEDMLADYDVVFAKARAAIEAMAVGCSVVLCDFTGLGGLVTAERFDHLRAWNFGAGVLTEPITQEGLGRQLARYDPAGAAEVSRRVRQEAGLDQAVDEWLALYREVLAEPVTGDAPGDRERLAVAARQWRGVRRIDRMRMRTAALRDRRSAAGALYRLCRRIWRGLGRPGALTL